MSAAGYPYVDQPVGDGAAAGAFAASAAAKLGLPAPTLMRVGMNALYRCGDVVMRVGRPNAPGPLSIELARRLRELGISVPEPTIDDVVEGQGLTATCWVPIEVVVDPVDWSAVGRIVRRVHALSRDDLPAGYPVPSPTTFPWWDFEVMIDEVRDAIDAPALGAIEREIDRHRGWTDQVTESPVVCHGDVHPGNVLMTGAGPVLLDWDLLCLANRGWDHAMLLTLAARWGGDPTVYPQFAEGYGRSLRDDPAALAFARLRNVAATLMRVRTVRTDPAARAEAERRLRFWRGDPDAPMWSAQ